jgi:hypothetical protein
MLDSYPWLVGPFSNEETWDYFGRIMEYEEWNSFGRDPDNIDFVYELPPEHRYVTHHWPFASEFFRFSVISQTEQLLGLNPWARAIGSRLVQISRTDPQGFSNLLDAVDTATDHFVRQRNNAYRQLRANPSHVDPVERFRGALAIYQSYYEVTLPIWLLGVIGKALASGRVDAAGFGGPSSKGNKGALIDAVRLALRGHYLALLFDKCYDRPLRNAIGHNDYEIRTNHGALSIYDPNSNNSWTFETVWAKLVATQHMHQSVFYGLSLARHVVNRPDKERLAQCGIAACHFALQPSGPPLITIFQLWCFWELDLAGAWLDDSRIQIGLVHDSVQKVCFTEWAYSEGRPLGPELEDRLAQERCATVRRIPVGPFLGRGFPAFSRLDGARYEVLGPGDDHLVPVGLRLPTSADDLAT